MRGGDEDVVRLLLENGAKVNNRNMVRTTCPCAAAYIHTLVVQNKDTALTVAAYQGKAGAVGMLLEAGANLSARNEVRGKRLR